MRHAKGFVLFTALVMLAALTIITLALVRAVDTTNEVANNIGFLQSTMTSSDRGIEDAVAWLQNNAGLLNNDSVANGYYARDIEQIAASKLIDYTGSATPGNINDDVDWDGSSGAPYKARLAVASDGSGNQISYIIHRLCDNYGSPGEGGVRCARMSLTTSGGGSKGTVEYGSYAISSKSQVYYRITTRAKGPRNTASYVQSTVVIEY